MGQTCFEAGEAKNTYGTGCFLLMNTGTRKWIPKSGLLTTMGYKFGDQPAHYALEGSIAITGALVQWVRDNLGLIEKSSDIESLARTVNDNGGVYFVPAFSGLYAPYWKDSARGVITGLTRYANKGHIARAAGIDGVSNAGRARSHGKRLGHQAGRAADGRRHGH